MGENSIRTNRSLTNHKGVFIGLHGPDIDIGRFVTQKELRNDTISTL
jgi:hypothetical protein